MHQHQSASGEPASLKRRDARLLTTSHGPGNDDLLTLAVHELFTAGLDLHTTLALLAGHIDLARSRVHTVIARLDDTIKTIRQAQVHGAPAKAANDLVVELVAALVGGVGLASYLGMLIRHGADMRNVDAAGLIVIGKHAEPRLAAAYPEAAVRPLCELREGPCHDTCRTGQPVTVPDLTDAGGRWPLFTTRARAAGFRAVRTLPVRSGDVPVGALALFSTTVDQPSASDVPLAQGLVGLAALAVVHDRALRQRDLAAEQLRAVLVDHPQVEQAKGILAERHTISVSAAHTAMTTHAHLHGMLLPDLARAVIDGTTDVSETV